MKLTVMNWPVLLNCFALKAKIVVRYAYTKHFVYLLIIVEKFIQTMNTFNKTEKYFPLKIV